MAPTPKFYNDIEDKSVSHQSEKVEIKPFSLDNFEAKACPIKNIQNEEVDSYIQQLCSYEAEVVEAVIARY